MRGLKGNLDESRSVAPIIMIHQKHLTAQKSRLLEQTKHGTRLSTFSSDPLPDKKRNPQRRGDVGILRPEANQLDSCARCISTLHMRYSFVYKVLLVPSDCYTQLRGSRSIL